MKVKFVPQNIELEINPGQSVLDLAQQNDIHIQSVCKGIPSCAECRVYIKEGDHNVMPPQPKELELIGTAYFIDQRRLSCQLRCFGDVTIDLTEQIEKQSKSTKNPQGRYVKEREDSMARMGNLLEELTDVEKEYEAELEAERKNSESSTSSSARTSKIDSGSFYKTSTPQSQNNKQQGNRPQNNKPQGNRPQNSRPQNNNNPQAAKANNSQPRDPNSPESGGSNAKRNRNRRRNKNRNAKSNGGGTSAEGGNNSN
jgi:ferredoxin